MKQYTNKSLVQIIGKSYNFRLYTYTPRGVHKIQLYDEHSSEVSLMPQEAVPVKAQTLLGTIAPTLLPTKLELGKSVAIYKPQRVVGKSAWTRALSWSHGVGYLECPWSPRRDSSAKKGIRFWLACRDILARVGSRRVEIIEELCYGKSALGLCGKFITSQDEDSLKVALPLTIKLRDPFLWARKKMGPLDELRSWNKFCRSRCRGGPNPQANGSN